LPIYAVFVLIVMVGDVMTILLVTDIIPSGANPEP
jgi:hypothetical protein